MKYSTVILVMTLVVSINSADEAPCVTKSGLVGTCKPITQCLFITDLLNEGNFGDLTACDVHDGSVGIFCCPMNNTNKSNSNINESCLKILNLKEQLAPKVTQYDGKSSRVTVGELPFMAQIFFPEKGFVGSGALISEKFVVSAAHVVYVRRSLPIVRLGKVIASQ